ncbi:PulJ/GspJ family protein, partial [Facilibium subflavum]
MRNLNSKQSGFMLLEVMIAVAVVSVIITMYYLHLRYTRIWC